MYVKILKRLKEEYIKTNPKEPVFSSNRKIYYAII